MNYLQLQNDVFRRIGENPDVPVYFMRDDVKKALNEGYEDISEFTEWYETHDHIGPTVGIMYHNLQLLFADEPPIRVTAIFNQTTNHWLVPTSVRQLDQGDFSSWQSIQGQPEKWFIRGLWFLGLWPVPAESAGTIDVYYSSLPPALTVDGDTPGFAQEFHLALVEYALFDLLAQEGETKEALMHWKKYVSLREALRQWVQARNLERVGGHRG